MTIILFYILTSKLAGCLLFNAHEISKFAVEVMLYNEQKSKIPF